MTFQWALLMDKADGLVCSFPVGISNELNRGIRGKADENE
jgi:hypothetical protein